MVEFLIGILIFVVGFVGGLFSARFLLKKHLANNIQIPDEVIASMLKGLGQPVTKERISQIQKQMSVANQNKKK